MIATAFVLTSTVIAFGQATSVTSTGFGANEGGGGALNLGWTTGNLGNTWSEGEWVPYQLIINNVQTDYPGLAGFPDIVMEYDFTAQNDARFVDLVRSIQAGTAQLTDLQGWPRDDGTAYPMTTRTEIEQAQNDFGNTPPLENTWTGFTLLNLPNSQVNRAAPPGFLDGTPDDEFRYFYITLQDLLDAGIPTTANTIVIYYQLHESRSFIWTNSLQEGYDVDPTDDWGGYLYSLPAFAADSRLGAGHVPGSSGQIRVSFAGGDKTVPIPIPQSLPGSVSGLKWNDINGDGIQDPGEPLLDGWRIYVKGTLEGINFADTTLTTGGGIYSFPNLTSGTTWFIYEDAQRFSPATTGWSQTYPVLASVMGVGSGWAVAPPDPTKGDFGWQVPLTLTDTGQANLNFGNMMCTIEIACPPDTTLECTESTDTLYTGVPTVNANCGLETLVYSDSIAAGACPQEYTIYRQFIATDSAGNADTCVQVITVEDNNLPWITGVGAADTVECPTAPPFSTPSAFDSCDTDVDLTFVDSTFPGACPQEYSVKRTWTATDDCGNFVTASQTIWVEDNTPPVLSGCPDDTTVLCSEDLPTPANVTALDACAGTVTPVFSYDSTGGDCAYEFTLVRKWVATDSCGNADSCMQTITVVDTLGPVLTCAADDTIACEDNLVFTPPTVDDGCNDNVTIEVLSTDTTSGPGLGEFTYTRTWTAYDSCSAKADTCAQNIVREVCGEFPCTYTQGGWGTDCPETQQGDLTSTQPGCMLANYFATVFPSGVIIGDPAGPGAGPGNWYAAKWTTAAAVQAFLPAGGKPKTLTSDLGLNPVFTPAGTLAGQILALKLNVGFSCAGIFYDLGLQTELTCYGDWVIEDTCGSKFAGLTVNEFLIIADSVVGGQTAVLTAYGATISDVNNTATCLNELYNNCFVEEIIVVTSKLDNLPMSYALDQNYPNPFNPATTISFALPQATEVTLEIYNVLGQKVATVANGYFEAGSHQITWDATSQASGVYLYRLTTSDFTMTRKMLLLK